MLMFEGHLVIFLRYLPTIPSFLQRFGALNARPEGLFWSFVCTWISFVGLSANLHVFVSMFFFSTVTTIVTLKQNDPILLVWLEKQLSGSRYTEIMADGDRFTLPANQKKLRFLRGGLGLGEVVVSDDC